MPDDLLQSTDTSSVVSTVLVQILKSSVFVNLALMAFNLLPIAPLDGSNILRQFIPYRYEDRYNEFARISPFILIGLIVLENISSIHILSAWVFGIMSAVLTVFDTIGSFL